MKKLSLVIVIALSFPAVWWAMERDRDPAGRPSAPAERVEPSLKITARSERHNIGANSRNDDAPPGWPDDVPFLDRRTQVPLDWDLATLEKYLDYCKTQLPGNHLASLMTRIFPYPEGGGNHPGVMLEGSISLSDQMALCDHYLDPLGRQLAHSNIYRKYQEAGRLDLYRSELLEKLPQDSYRRDRFWDFYLEQFRETGVLLRFLESEEPTELMREGNYYDYKAAVSAVESTLEDLLDGTDDQFENISSWVQGSSFSPSDKQEMMRVLGIRQAYLARVRESGGAADTDSARPRP